MKKVKQTHFTKRFTDFLIEPSGVLAMQAARMHFRRQSESMVYYTMRGPLFGRRLVSAKTKNILDVLRVPVCEWFCCAHGNKAATTEVLGITSKAHVQSIARLK